jgi:hypothetical protein
MTRDLSSDEVLKEYQKVFPGQTGDLFYYLWTDIANLHIDWRNYRILYGTSAERIDLLNQIAPSFFSRTEIILRHDILIRIMRLIDSSKTFKRDNASIRKLIEDLREYLDDAVYQSIEKDYQDAKAAAENMKILRDKKIAHADFSVALKYNPEPFQGISRANVEAVLEIVRKIMNKIEMYYRRTTTVFENPIVASGNAEALVLMLEKAKIHQNERR